MVGLPGTVGTPVKVLKPQRKFRSRAVNTAEIENLLLVWTQQRIKDGVRDDVDRSSRAGYGAKNAGLEGRPVALLKHGTDQHPPHVRILAFTHRLDATPLPDQAAHGRVLVPDVAELNFGYLPKGIVRLTILAELKQGQLSHQLAHGGPAQDV